MSAVALRERLGLFLKTLKLPSFAADHREVARTAKEESWSYERYLVELCEREVTDRQERRIERLLRQSRLPLEKTKETLDTTRLTAKVRKQLAELYEAEYQMYTSYAPLSGNSARNVALLLPCPVLSSWRYPVPQYPAQ